MPDDPWGLGQSTWSECTNRNSILRNNYSTFDDVFFSQKTEITTGLLFFELCL